MKNLLILLGILLSSPFVVAQHSAINGNVAIANNSPEGTRVVVIKNGNKLDEQVLNKKGHFDLKLAFDADYKISFEKTGYITKIISINTEVPEESIENNPDFPPVKLIINLLPSVEKIDLSIFDQPIAILTYQAELDDFTFDKSYSDKIKDRIAQTEQAVKKQLAARDAAAIEQERKFAELFNKGLESFGRKAWQAAIDSWTLAQNMKPERVSNLKTNKPTGYCSLRPTAYSAGKSTRRLKKSMPQPNKSRQKSLIPRNKSVISTGYWQRSPKRKL